MSSRTEEPAQQAGRSAGHRISTSRTRCVLADRSLDSTPDVLRPVGTVAAHSTPSEQLGSAAISEPSYSVQLPWPSVSYAAVEATVAPEHAVMTKEGTGSPSVVRRIHVSVPKSPALLASRRHFRFFAGSVRWCPSSTLPQSMPVGVLTHPGASASSRADAMGSPRDPAQAESGGSRASTIPAAATLRVFFVGRASPTRAARLVTVEPAASTQASRSTRPLPRARITRVPVAIVYRTEAGGARRCSLSHRLLRRCCALFWA